MSPTTKSVEDSERVSVIVAVSATSKVDLSETTTIVGRTVFTVKVTVLFASAPSALKLFAALLNFVSATLITPFVVLLAVGVNVAV
jgi:hypothetical protein